MTSNSKAKAESRWPFRRRGTQYACGAGATSLPGAAGAMPVTDLPLNLVRSEPVPGRVIYWALTDPLPTRDPDNGPFLKPPACKPNPVPVQQGLSGHFAPSEL